MTLRRAVAVLAAVLMFTQFGCATGKWAKSDPWPEYPPPGAYAGEGRYASGHWWMPSKIGPADVDLSEYGNGGVIFYAGEITPPPEPSKPPEIKVVEKIVYKPIPVKREVRADRYIFPTITFNEGSAELPPKEAAFDASKGEFESVGSQIESAAEIIKKAGCDTVFVEGNIDSAEKAKYADLGQKRAQVVKNALVGMGIDANVLVVKDYGASNPLAKSDTELGRALNRRVTFTILPRGASLEAETLVQPPAPQGGPNIKIVEKIVEKEVAVPELVITDHVIFAGINFEYDKAELTPAGLTRTDKAAEVVKSMDRINKVTVEGHCDWRGSDEYNQKLSEKRANTVKSRLIEKGVPAAMLESVGYGESQPIASNDTALGMALNRRVEFEVKY